MHRFDSDRRLLKLEIREQGTVYSKKRGICFLSSVFSWASGGMAYTQDLKSCGRKAVRVRLPPCPFVCAGRRRQKFRAAPAQRYYKKTRKRGRDSTDFLRIAINFLGS